jgi:hypothetical protein
MSYKPTYVGDTALMREFEEISASLLSFSVQLQRAYSPPARPRFGMVVICDGSAWDPIGDGTQRPVWFNGSAWQVFG